MSSEGTIELVVQGDDFGMCHAVNEGIRAAFVDGVLTQASFMAACPWAQEALSLARQHAIPLGLHQTLTCDWENFRWGPLTKGPSLAGEDGSFPSTVAEAAARVDPPDAEAELRRQAGVVQRAGLRLGYLDVHMGMVCPPAYQRLSEELGLPFLYPGLATSLKFASIRGLSERPAGAKKSWLLHHLERLTTGVHLLVTHPGVAGPELASLTTSASPVHRWAEDYRASDLETLTDAEVAAAIESLGIRLTSVVDAVALAPAAG
ncbi:MAG TPA: ChbG/HpnK family deacetylase [Acidimicrobiales bacterium]|nr:ChbG/HpnK family deacetylase [Acidimicrobiales bacterium]